MYTAVTDSSIVIIIDGKAKTISRGSAVSAKLLKEISKPNPDENVVALLADMKEAFGVYTGRDMEIKADGTVWRNGVQLPDMLGEKVVACFREGVDYKSLLNFFDNLNANPSKRAVTELFKFLQHKGMPITPDGCFLAYKGVDHGFWSITAGDRKMVIKGKVNEGGHIFNGIGEEIEVVKNYVDDNPENHCSTGLHAGSESYATDFARGHVVLVKINPKDVISVPSDCGCQKLRTCRYVVVGEYTGRLNDGGVTDAFDAYGSASKVDDSFDYGKRYADDYDDDDDDVEDDDVEDDDDDVEDEDDEFGDPAGSSATSTPASIGVTIHVVDLANPKTAGEMRSRMVSALRSAFGAGL